MAYSAIGILFIVVQSAYSQACPRCNSNANLLEAFNDFAVTDFTLAQAGNVGLMDCVVICSRDIRCRSYRHNALTNTCSTYGAGYSLPGNTLNPVTAEAGSRLYAMCGMTSIANFGSSCSSTTDCNFVNSACLSGSCSCVVGFSYYVPTGNCIARCSTYGDSFTVYPNHGVLSCNIKVIRGVTREECMLACALENTFTCINTELQLTTGDCTFCDTAWYDLDPSARQYNEVGWEVYYRHCGY